VDKKEVESGPIMINQLGYGFNAQWAYSSETIPTPKLADKRMLDFMAKYKFNFLRLPLDYRYWMPNLNNPPLESFLDVIDGYVHESISRGIHISINLHRAPGYCINGWEKESTNLWSDELPQKAFETLWKTLATKYQGRFKNQMSFDLVNEPPDIGQRGFTRDIHEKVIRKVTNAIHAIDSDRIVVINGLAGGHLAMPELADLSVVHSGRGYQPMLVSHYQAEWWDGSKGMPVPTYPCEYNGQWWDFDALWEFYGPWRDVQAKGRPIHIGEFGCYKYTDNEVALKWFRDLFEIYRRSGWGYSLWEFDGNFGIANHNRPGVRYESFEGLNVDRQLLDLMLESRIE
jgi:aryl-phospho-beta-D-glucosidase BglC (GH1 family)